MTSPPRLSANTLAAVRPGVAVPAYDRAGTSIGIVHFGPGAFHRGHQACYFDSLLVRDPRWAISGVELLPAGLAAQAVAQDLLYVVAELDAQIHYRVVGSHREYLTAANDRERIFARLNDPNVKLVTITVTEKGYCLDRTGALDVSHPAIAEDLRHAPAPGTLVGWITEALARRRAAKLAPFTVLSCDNMVENGRKLRDAIVKFAGARGDRDLAAWIAGEVRFPSCMVDSITPAATEELKRRVEEAVGLRDEAPVQREAFQQWVVENILPPGSPDLAGVGALITNDIAAHELAKLRLLNGAHSVLAYAGLLRGHNSVGETMRDARLSRFVGSLMREDMVPSLKPTPGLDFDATIAQLLGRFRNPALTHSLWQIAQDGSQKLPYRIVAPLSEALAAGRPVERFAYGIAAWMRFVVREARAGRPLADPLCAVLTAVGCAATGDAANDLPGFLALRQVFPGELTAAPIFVNALRATYGKFDTFLG
ncbi:MAG TPA: mannitol dehydrogenase family protein [Rhizomicrobium sp.]|nr:mannitol dehydrogenase family protein [Rhizomicrobium sp.]